MTQKSNQSLILTLSFFFLSVSNCQTTSGKIAGIGVGTFIIIIAIAFSVVWCLACRSSSYPQIYSIIGVAIPIILIIIFILMPKQADRPVTTSITDSNFIPHIVFMVISILGLILAIAFLMINQVFAFKKAKNIARAAFIMKEEEEDKVVPNQNQALESRQSEVQSKSNNQISLGDSPRRHSESQIQQKPLRR